MTDESVALKPATSKMSRIIGGAFAGVIICGIFYLVGGLAIWVGVELWNRVSEAMGVCR